MLMDYGEKLDIGRIIIDNEIAMEKFIASIDCRENKPECARRLFEYSIGKGWQSFIIFNINRRYLTSTSKKTLIAKTKNVVIHLIKDISEVDEAINMLSKTIWHKPYFHI